jgi:chromosome segregation ATPase
MTRILVKIFLILLFLASVGTIVFLGHKQGELRKENDLLEERLKDADNRVKLLKQRYAEQKALAGGLMRTKRVLEGQRAVFEERIRGIEKEMQVLAEKRQALKLEGERTKKALEGKIKEINEISEKLAESKKVHKENVQKHKEIIKKYDAEKKRLKEEYESLDSEQKRVNREMERCKSNNQNLCKIAQDLVRRYQKKGLLDAVIVKEPLTKLKQVELEKYVQEYQEKIQQNSLVTEPSSNP